jgi:hypothetical protein
MKPPTNYVNRDRLAADIMIGLTAKFAIKQPSAGETSEIARLAFIYADAFIKVMEAQS